MKHSIGRSDPIRAAQVVTVLHEYLSRELSSSDGKLPKYMQLKDALVRAIDTGVVLEGDKLPSEKELSSISLYSLGTVQKAVKSLMDAGLVKRKTGVGTIVRRPVLSMGKPLHARFSRNGGPFLPIFPRLLNRGFVHEHGPWNDVFGKDAKILRLDRRTMIGDVFAIVNLYYCDADRNEFFLTREFDDLHTENYKTIVHRETNRRLTRLDHKITFATAPDDIAKLIDVEAGEQLMMIKLTAWDQADEVIYFQVLYIPPNGLDLTIESMA